MKTALPVVDVNELIKRDTVTDPVVANTVDDQPKDRRSSNKPTTNGQSLIEPSSQPVINTEPETLRVSNPPTIETAVKNQEIYSIPIDGRSTWREQGTGNTSGVAEIEQRRIEIDTTKDTVPLFFNGELGQLRQLRQEKPEHRLALILASKGFTTSEIAKEVGMCEATINNLKRQPWAVKYLSEMMEKQGRKIVMSQLTGAALEAAQTLISTMKGELGNHKEASVRAKAANDILDRCYGTATNVTVTGKVDLKDIATDELAAIAMGKN